MSKRRSGAPAARGGFRDQATVTLSEALSNDEWVEMWVEGTDEDSPTDKVDTFWRMHDGTTCADQIKSYTNPTSLAPIERWAKGLAEESDADRLRILYVGPLGTQAQEPPRFERVEFVHKADRMTAVVDGCLVALGAATQGINPNASALEAAVQQLIDVIDAAGIDGASWTRSQWRELVEQTVRHAIKSSSDGEHHLRIKLDRTVVVHSNGLVHELIRYDAANHSQSPRPVTIDATWTDSTDMRLLHGAASNPSLDLADWDRRGETHPFVITAYMPESVLIGPGESVWWGFVVERADLISEPPANGRFTDPLLPTATRHQADVTLIVEGMGDWVVLDPPPARVSGNVAMWEVATSARVSRLHAEWIRSSTHAPLDEVAHTAELLRNACGRVGIRGGIPPLLVGR